MIIFGCSVPILSSDLEVELRDGPLVICVAGPSPELRVGTANGPKLDPFYANGGYARSMFQLVPTGPGSVEPWPESDDEASITWRYHLRYIRATKTGTLVRTASLSLVRMTDYDDADDAIYSWALDIEIESVRMGLTLDGFAPEVAMPDDLLPSWARAHRHASAEIANQ